VTSHEEKFLMAPTEMHAAQPAPPKGSSYTAPFLAVTVLFLIFGFITALNAALVPHLRSIFNLSYAWAMLVESAFYLAYLVFSTPSSRLIEAIGYKWTMVTSLGIQVIGCLLFLPAAKLVSFPFFLSAVFVLGAGVTALQTSANPYVAILGPEESAPVRLNLAQAFNSIGTTLAPLVAGAYILTDPAQSLSKARIADTVRIPYVLLAGTLLLLALVLSCIRLPHLHLSSRIKRQFRPGEAALPERSIWSYRHTVLGALGIFTFVGVEVGLASIAVNFFKSQGVSSAKSASFLVSLYWFGMLIGRLAGSWALTRVKSDALLAGVALMAVMMVTIAIFAHGPLAIWPIVLCGLCNSVMFPNIFALGVSRLGPMTSKGSGLMMGALVGGAVIPYLLGVLADRFGIQQSFALAALCYLYIAYYGRWGCKPRLQ
jgi:FHS family L-fucose permease-like MFS transporter